MKKVRYIGGSDQRILSTADMAAIGIEDHPGLWFTQAEPVLEVEDDVAEAVLGLRGQFKQEATDDELVEDLVDEESRDDLAERAKAMGVKGTSKMNKEELAEAIVAKEAEIDAANKDKVSEGVPSSDEGASAEPHS